MTTRSDPKSTAQKAAKKSRKNMVPSELQSETPPIHDLIGQKLRAYYDEVAKAPVPERFSLLLKELEAKSSGKKPS